MGGNSMNKSNILPIKLMMTGKDIAYAVNEILKDIDKTKYKVVNWSDLRVIQVNETREIYPETEDRIYEVIISEASPENYDFQYELMTEFYNKYQKKIIVNTEW